jgi:hypothetical protein
MQQYHPNTTYIFVTTVVKFLDLYKENPSFIVC